MDVTQSHTESLKDIVKGIDDGVIMLPEFQRDFRWEVDQTLALFDSLVKDIFIGTIIYGKPSFGMTLREIDKRPRRGVGSRAKVNTKFYNDKEIKTASQVRNLRIVLDGQQRITSIYRALTGIGDDKVFLVLNDYVTFEDLKPKSLEEIAKCFQTEQDPDAISVLLSDAFRAEIEQYDDEQLYAIFEDSSYGKQLKQADPVKLKDARKVYRVAVKKLTDLFKMQKMVAYYLLDMSLDKFCLFFERSNSRGILLNFTDILAAKLYHGFNLRKAIDEYENKNPSIVLNKELVIRAIAYIKSSAPTSKAVSIDKQTILTDLTAEDFAAHWASVCNTYTECINYLREQNYIVSQSWIPSENMVLPLMMLRRRIKGFDQMNETQRKFLQFWFWASIFSNRYSGSSNEVIITDSKILEQIANGEKIAPRTCARMRSRIESADDLFSFTKRGASIYRGVLNLIAFEHGGLKDWNNTQTLSPSMALEAHHIYPQAYIRKAGANLDVPSHETEDLVDSVVNIALIPKLTNIRIGARPPSAYLTELRKQNPKLENSLQGHCINSSLLMDPSSDTRFMEFLRQRADNIWQLIQKMTSDQIEEMGQAHESTSDMTDDEADARQLPRLPELCERGLLKKGDVLVVDVDERPEATLVNETSVEFNGKVLLINAWAQQVTGWRSVNVYRQVKLKRTGQTLQTIRLAARAAEEIAKVGTVGTKKAKK